MKAVQLPRFGGPDMFQIVDMPMPVAGSGEVLVRVEASGVNFFEVLMREDRYAVTPELPMVFGVEAVGIVTAVGDGVAFPRIGARVAVPLFATARACGGYAEYVVADADCVVALPGNLASQDAVALMVQGLTAMHLVRRSRPEGKTILVNAAAGGVGSLLVQLAKGAGAKRIVAAAGAREKLDLARDLGADAAIDYTRPDWTKAVRDATGGTGVDIVYEFSGGAHTRRSFETLAPGGDLIFGALGRFDLEFAEMEAVFAKNQSLRGFALLPLLTPANLKMDLTELFDRAARGALKVVQGGHYPLGQVAEAHRALEGRRTSGKVVLVP
ncbi:MAG: quinone oxidoreductase family protein [Phyllobacterium sp.]